VMLMALASATMAIIVQLIVWGENKLISHLDTS
jgi:hypothetical protein